MQRVLAQPGDDLCDEVRRHCAAIAEGARWVRIDEAAEIPDGGVDGLDANLHLLDASHEDVARYILILDTINFGSGWFPTLRAPASGESLTDEMSRRLTEHARRRGSPWSAEELRSLRAADVAAALGQDPAHALMALYAQALRELGGWLGDRSALDAIAEAGGSAAVFARELARGMPFFDDRGFYKRAQITANDLVLAGVAGFEDVDRLTVFADNLLPHVLRLDGVLRYERELAATVDAGTALAPGSAMEVEIRACAVHACELLAGRLGIPSRTLDNWLWNRGNSMHPGRHVPHLTRTTFY
jgi:hypothetical protein